VEHLRYIDDIFVWVNRAEEIFDKQKKIIQILLKAEFAIKLCKVKAPAQGAGFRNKMARWALSDPNGYDQQKSSCVSTS